MPPKGNIIKLAKTLTHSLSLKTPVVSASRRNLYVGASDAAKKVLPRIVEDKIKNSAAKMLAGEGSEVLQMARQAIIAEEARKLQLSAGVNKSGFVAEDDNKIFSFADKEVPSGNGIQVSDVVAKDFQNAGDVVDIKDFQISESRINAIMLQKYQHYLENDLGGKNTIIGNMNNAERKDIFILTEIKFDFDFDKGIFTIIDIEKLRQKYNETFYGEGKDKKYAKFDFEYQLEKFFNSIKTSILAMRRSKDAKDYIADFPQLLAATKSKIFKAKKPADIGGEEVHFANSVYKHGDILKLSKFQPTNKFNRAFATSLVISSILEDAARKAYGEKYDEFFKLLEFSQERGSFAYPRDYSVFYGEEFHQTDDRVAKNMADKKDVPQELERLDSHAADLVASGLRSIRDIPFDAKGGNIIITQNTEGKKVLIATVSDAYYNDDGRFKGGYMIDKEGNLVNYTNSIFSLFDKYPLFCDRIKEWGKSIGCDEVVVIDRNLEGVYKGQFNQLYHLDVFCGALPGGFCVVNPAAVTPQNLAELQRVFGADKIIEISQEEHKEICANFIVFDKTVVMSSPNTPQSFIEKLNECGFDVYVPGLYMAPCETLNAGWLAGVRCFTSSANKARVQEREVPETRIEPLSASSENVVEKGVSI